MARTAGTTPEQAATEARAAGYEPLEPYPGRVTAPWLLRCKTCGYSRKSLLAAIRRGSRCAHTRYSPEAATEILNQQGFEPLEPYPGSSVCSWHLRCVGCGRERRASLTVMRTMVCPCAKRAQRALAELRAAGYEPLEPYPGKTRAPWLSRCTACKQERTPNLNTIRSGKRCLHRTPEDLRRPTGTL